MTWAGSRRGARGWLGTLESGAPALLLLLLATSVVGCPNATSPAAGPEARCVAACEARAPSCDEASCVRGCKFVLDRVVEHQGAGVIACVAKAETCDDASFADCAARTGPYTDGGPAPPGPVKDIDLDDDDTK